MFLVAGLVLLAAAAVGVWARDDTPPAGVAVVPTPPGAKDVKAFADPFAWDPNGARDPWFQRVGVQMMKPISRQGRMALVLLILAMSAAIPAAVGLVLAGVPPEWVLPVFLLGFVVASSLFVWMARGRVKL